jgi:uncharacterized membrane protein
MDTPITTGQVSASDHPHHITGALHWPERFHHLRFPGLGHAPAKSEIINVNKVHDEQLTIGAKIADRVAATVGSWPFIIVQSILLGSWIVVNSLAWIYHYDPYPFILLNLALSFQAAYAAPFVMMSQNRQAAKDRLTAENDYKTDMQGEEEIRHILAHLEHQDLLIIQIIERLEHQHQEILQRMNGLDPAAAQQPMKEVSKPEPKQK